MFGCMSLPVAFSKHCLLGMFLPHTASRCCLHRCRQLRPVGLSISFPGMNCLVAPYIWATTLIWPKLPSRTTREYLTTSFPFFISVLFSIPVLHCTFTSLFPSFSPFLLCSSFLCFSSVREQVSAILGGDGLSKQRSFFVPHELPTTSTHLSTFSFFPPCAFLS